MQAKRIRQLILILVFLVLPALFLRAHIKNPNHLNGFDRFLLRVSSPVQGVFSKAAWVCRDFASHYLALVDTKRDNERLAEANGQMRAHLQSLQAQEEKVRRLEALLSLKESWRDRAVAAQVVQLDSFPTPNRLIVIRLAEKSALVQAGMPVVTSVGVIGKVLDVIEGYAKVQLITDPSFSLPVHVSRTHSLGSLHGGGTQKALRVDSIERKDDIKVGDIVSTAGIGTPESGTVMPANLLIGPVTEVHKPTAGFDQQVLVSSAVSMDSLRDVLVLLTPQPPTELLPHRPGVRGGGR